MDSKILARSLGSTDDDSHLDTLHFKSVNFGAFFFQIRTGSTPMLPFTPFAGAAAYDAAPATLSHLHHIKVPRCGG